MGIMKMLPLLATAATLTVLSGCVVAPLEPAPVVRYGPPPPPVVVVRPAPVYGYYGYYRPWHRW
jgi:hypothetical protein